MTTMSPEDRLIEDIATGKRKDLDGIMSPLTQRLLLKLGATGVDMTEYWIRTPQHWTCPACDRNKEQLVRKNSHNQLMCKLVSHHDHMQDLLLERFRSTSASLSKVVADEVAERFARRAVSMVASYDNTLICQDCNAADASAKKAAGTHPKFSYSPSEIKRIVVSKSNSPHDINASIACEIWEGNKDTFSLRLKIVDRIAEIAATNSHWYQEVYFHYHPDTIYKKSLSTLQTYYNISTLPYHRLGGGGKPAEDFSSWRTKTFVGAKETPTAGDCSHVAKVTSSRDWKLVDDDWICPVCKRSKVETVRKNNKNEWSFTVAAKSYRSVTALNKTEKFNICNDCGMVANFIGKEAIKSLGFQGDRYSMWVELSDISSVIRPRPHSRHEILQDKAVSIVARVTETVGNEMCE
ncbi:hypothetical protein [Geomonas propionica]|uniref:Uncharacterized protein n=1 Tax=Geomonas propionica TaxID=2798582 RepID=A0ABS0YUF1_9BACT|nr:hypothetical protein [Geomonas propionica]MBJ6801503.1 hypothetical protein [Geomonas propionica]